MGQPHSYNFAIVSLAVSRGHIFGLAASDMERSEDRLSVLKVALPGEILKAAVGLAKLQHESLVKRPFMNPKDATEAEAQEGGSHAEAVNTEVKQVHDIRNGH